MRGERVLLLYRPRVPGLRAQAIQVLHAAHALAARGHRVTVLADRAAPGARPADALRALGLEPVRGLDLRLAPARHKGLAGLWFRAALGRWWAGPPGVVVARDKRRLLAALRALGARRHRVVVEAHELDSALAEEAGRDPGPARALEAAVLRRAAALVANCGGTLALWEEVHGEALPPRRRAVHNATAPGRRRAPVARPERVARCLGSARAFKDIDLLERAAPLLPVPLEVRGPGHPERREGRFRTGGPVPYPEVPDLLARSAVLVLPLADNLFGRRLTSPLKLWDYLATAVPVVAPDLPAVREVAALSGAPLHLHRPGDPEDLARAIRAALDAPPRAPFLRTWDERAAELEEVAFG